MKHLIACFLATAGFLDATSVHAQNLLPPKPGAPTVITRVDEILKWIPEGVTPRKRGVPWTAPQIDIVNEALKKQFESRPYVLSMTVPVSEVANWNNNLQIFSEIPNREGYHIRLFWVFTPDWKERLAKLNVGDRVAVTGTLAGLKYETLWNAFTLSIATKDSRLTK